MPEKTMTLNQRKHLGQKLKTHKPNVESKVALFFQVPDRTLV